MIAKEITKIYESFIRKSIDELIPNQLNLNITTVDRTVGAILSGAIAKKYGNKGLPNDTININFNGIAGQSFGGYLINGINLTLEGEANDYVGKSMNGGTIAIYPNTRTNFEIEGNSIVGNTVLYGATSGKLFAAGQAGDRFAVRNSGAITVIEGCDSNGCEYMTGGTAVILGDVGDNFAAGMTGGMAFIYDKSKSFDKKVNPESVVWQSVETDYWKKYLRDLVKEHFEETESFLSENIIKNFDEEVENFVQVCPKEMIGKLQYPITSKLDIQEVS